VPVFVWMLSYEFPFIVFNEILAHFIIDKFISAEDLTVKAAALALIEVSWHRTYELWSSILP
jgi:hypothetical protein